jgi:hypothetical protein
MIKVVVNVSWKKILMAITRLCKRNIVVCEKVDKKFSSLFYIYWLPCFIE